MSSAKFLEKFFDVVELFFHENGSLLTRKLNELPQNKKKEKTPLQFLAFPSF